MIFADIFVDVFGTSVLHIAVVYFFVVIFAAIIGFLGNYLGRKYGRKKASLANLRPQYTAYIISACTGAIIAVLTLTIFAIFSEPVRGLLGGVDKLRREEAELRATVEQLKKTVAEGMFIWTIGEPIVHMTLPEGLSKERTRDAITSLLAEANSRAILRNNKIAKEKKEELLKVSDILIESDPKNLEDTIYSLSNGTGVAGLRIVAERNCLYREKSPVYLETWQVKRVFKRDEIILRRRLSIGYAAGEFYQFIEDIKSKAIQRGMIPIDGSLGGGLSQSEFNSLQEQMSCQHGDFFLIARANRDLYETNSLDISLSVEPIESISVQR